MKKIHFLPGWFGLLMAMTLCVTGGDLFADAPAQSPAGSTDLAQQAQDALQQAQSPKDYQDAAALFEKAAKADPNNYDVRLTLGWIYFDKLHVPEAAYPYLKTVVKHRPSDVNARKLLGMVCTQTGRHAEALTQFREASRLQPNDVWIKTSLGRAYAHNGDYWRAAKIYDEVLKTDPSNADARLGRAELEAWSGQSDKALAILDGLLKENPNNVEALTLEADIHRWKWKLSEAKDEYRQILATDTNNVAALAGLKETKRMEADEIGANVYGFEDTTKFLRESAGADVRIYLLDRMYLIGGADGWKFNSPGIGNIYRIDGRAGLEYHWARWLETTLMGDVYDYRPGDFSQSGRAHSAFGGGELSAKITPATGVDIYTIVSGNQPFVSSIATVTNALKQSSIGNGLDIKLFGPFSFQNSFQVARISDNNTWWEEKPQLSLKVPVVLETYIRAEYDYLNYERTNATYWSPENWSILWPVVDTAIPIMKGVKIVVDARAPYVFEKHEFGYSVEAGPALDICDHLEIKATYYKSSIPGDQGVWSGQGVQASVRLRF